MDAKKRDWHAPLALGLAILGLDVHLASIVPNCRFRCTYHIDSLDTEISTVAPSLAIKILRKINGQILKTALSAVIARPGQPCGPQKSNQVPAGARTYS
jgi:hypothetical protein